MLRIVACLAAFCFLGAHGGVHFGNCGSKVGSFSAVTVSGCDLTKSHCDLVKETDATISITFTPTEDITSVKTIVHGILANVPVPFPIENPDSCTNPESGITCPLVKGTEYHYQATLPVKKAYPRVTLQVKYELKNENEEDIICVLIPVTIVDKR